MQLILDVPEDLARLLGDGQVDLTKTALESLALAALRSGRLSISQARRLLNIQSRYEMDGFLKRHDILLPLTLDDVERDSETALAFRTK